MVTLSEIKLRMAKQCHSYVSSKELAEAREQFFGLQEKLLEMLVGTEKAKQFREDYFASGCSMGLYQAMAFPALVHQVIFNNILSPADLENKIESFSVRPNSHPDFRKQCADIHQFFNPEILYSAWIYPTSEENGTNFYVLKREVVNPLETAKVEEKATTIGEVLRFSEYHYHTINRPDPWRLLTNAVRELILKCNPDASVPEAHIGKITGWTSDALVREYTGTPGYLVESEGVGDSTTLMNTHKEIGLKEGDRVRFLVTQYVGMGFPTGKLVQKL